MIPLSPFGHSQGEGVVEGEVVAGSVVRPVVGGGVEEGQRQRG